MPGDVQLLKVVENEGADLEGTVGGNHKKSGDDFRADTGVRKNFQKEAMLDVASIM